MNLNQVKKLLEQMHQKYFNIWYNHTLPIKFNKVFEDDCNLRISEKMVQAIWNDSRYLNKNLSDDSGNPVKIISPGTWNTEPGPDFKNATINLDGKILKGDVEIHLSPSHWKAHGHQFDPAYKNVILHVVWELKNQKFPSTLPHLELSSQLTLSADKVMELTDLASYSKSRLHPAAECSEFISKVSDQNLQNIFRMAGFSRLHRKAQLFRQKVVKFGMEQAFYQQLAEAHGYKNNRQQFIRLSEKVPISTLQNSTRSIEKTALVWGAAGLLPDVTQAEVHPELRAQALQLWNIWWKQRQSSDQIIWNRSALRPLNSPERRVTALTLLLEKTNYNFTAILQDCLTLIPAPKKLNSYFDNLFEFNDNWNNFCNFKTKLKTPSNLIGKSRKLDIIINVFLPALVNLIEEQEEDKLAQIYLYYSTLQKSQENHVTDIATHKFFLPPYRARTIIKKASEQQGLIQLIQDFNLPDTPEEIASFWEELGINFQNKDNLKV